MQAVVEVELTAYAPVTDNTVTLCPDHNFELVFECLVRDASFITWRLPPLINNDGMFIYNDTQDPIIMLDKGTIISINNSRDESILTQLHVNTGDIIEELDNDASDHLNVSCLASNLTETMTIRISGLKMHDNFITGFDLTCTSSSTEMACSAKAQNEGILAITLIFQIN